MQRSHWTRAPSTPRVIIRRYDWVALCDGMLETGGAPVAVDDCGIQAAKDRVLSEFAQIAPFKM